MVERCDICSCPCYKFSWPCHNHQRVLLPSGPANDMTVRCNYCIAVSVCLSFHPSVCLSFCLSFCLSVCLSIYLSIYLPTYLPTHPPIHPSIDLSVCLFCLLSWLHLTSGRTFFLILSVFHYLRIISKKPSSRSVTN